MRKKLLLSFCAMVLASLTLFAQNTTVTGKVTDAQTGAPLSGVTISLNGKGLGVTKADGTYAIVVPSSAKKLTLVMLVLMINKLLLVLLRKTLN